MATAAGAALKWSACRGGHRLVPDGSSPSERQLLGITLEVQGIALPGCRRTTPQSCPDPRSFPPAGRRVPGNSCGTWGRYNSCSARPSVRMADLQALAFFHETFRHLRMRASPAGPGAGAVSGPSGLFKQFFPFHSLLFPLSDMVGVQIFNIRPSRLIIRLVQDPVKIIHVGVDAFHDHFPQGA